MPTNFDGTGRFRPDPSLPAPWEEQPKAKSYREVVATTDADTWTDRSVTLVTEAKLQAMRAELRTQLQQAWQRLDYKTADRIADLLGEPRPTEHEAKDKKHGG